jgi:hypothetical protein
MFLQASYTLSVLLSQGTLTKFSQECFTEKLLSKQKQQTNDEL